MYNFKIFETLTEECKKIWESTEKESSSTFFQNINYIEQLIKVNNNQTKIIMIFDDDKVLAILPLEIKKYFFISMLQWIGTRYADYCSPILSKNFDELYNKKEFDHVWSQILSKINGVDLVFLNNQLANLDSFVNPFVDCFKNTSFSEVYNIHISGDFDTYKKNIKKIDKKHAYEVHRTLIKYNKLNESSKVSLEVKDSYYDSIDLRSIIEEKKNQLFKKNINNKFDNSFVKVFEHLIKLKKTQFYMMSLKYEDQSISNCFGFKYKETFYYYIPTIPINSFDSFKPGKILIIKIIQWCIQNNIKTFDFGLGNEKYKKYFSNKEISLHRYLKYLTLKGSLACLVISLILKIKKLWL